MLDEATLARLPSRVRNYINKLESDLAHYRNVARRIENKETRVTIGYYDDKTFLPDDEKYTFLISDGREISVSLSELYTAHTLVPCIRIFGTFPLVVYPESSNTISLRMD